MAHQIAYCGIEGAFANLAAKRIFPNDTLTAFPSFDKAYEAVVQGKCDYAVLPLENSFAGDVSQVFDLLFQGPLTVSSIYYFHISQTLLGTQDSELSDIKTVISHQQAIDQCIQFIHDHKMNAIAVPNTAFAAQKVSKDNNKSFAAIASEESAGIYNLKILQKNINQDSRNTTRFAVFSKNEEAQIEPKPEAEQEKDYISMLVFSVKNKPGSLAKAIRMIGKKGFNLISLHSRPVKNLPWEYYFYAEVEGNMKNRKGLNLIKKMDKVCTQARIAGHFYKNKSLSNE